MILWQKTGATSHSRVAIAGDFLPASGLQLPGLDAWREAAAKLSNYFGEVDAGILNLECCVDSGKFQPRVKLGLGDIFTAPRDVLAFPSALGFKFVGVANNHAYDFGQDGLEHTNRAIRRAAMIPLGSTRSLSQPPDVAFTELPSGPRVGFWAAACHIPELAARNKPGIEPATRERGEAALAALKNCGSAVNIALIHAGLEHTNRPDPFDVALMDDLASIGFDLVAACHSHRISGFKRVERQETRPAFCFYGLGSICSGVLYSPLEREGLVVVFGVDKSGEIVEIEIKPVSLDEYGCGMVPDPSASAIILDRFSRLSEELHLDTYQQHFYREVGKDLFQRQLRDIHAAFLKGGMSGIAKKLSRIRLRHLNRLLHKSLG